MTGGRSPRLASWLVAAESLQSLACHAKLEFQFVPLLEHSAIASAFHQYFHCYSQPLPSIRLQNFQDGEFYSPSVTTLNLDHLESG